MSIDATPADGGNRQTPRIPSARSDPHGRHTWLSVARARGQSIQHSRSGACFALGLPLHYGLLAPVLLAAGLGFAWIGISFHAFLVLLLYGVVTTAYSVYLKTRPLVDVFTLAGLYAIRILAGGAAGLGHSAALDATLLTRLATLWFAVVLGVGCLALAGRRLRARRSPDAARAGSTPALDLAGGQVE
jgi:hypothetical protein